MTFQIFITMGDGAPQPGYRFEDTNTEGAAEREARQFFSLEESIVQQSADIIRKPITLELRNITTGEILIHKRITPKERL